MIKKLLRDFLVQGGVAKMPHDAGLHWLDPLSVPTMGHVFSQAGYECVWKGKWHLSNADIYKDGQALPTVREDGRLLHKHIDEYIREDVLRQFGFKGWVGPEPHGALYRNSGVVRDPDYCTQVTTALEKLSRQTHPFLLVASLVNPHDICLWPLALAKSLKEVGESKTVPTTAPPPTYEKNLKAGPRVLEQYQDLILRMYGPKWALGWMYEGDNYNKYCQYYYYLHKLVDEQMRKIIRKVEDLQIDNLYIIWTSDHGELLGSHGKLHQKWFQAYNEAIRVPFVCVPFRVGDWQQKSTKPKRLESNAVTSHVDVLPTMMALAGIETVDRRHFHIQKPLVGRNLSRQVKPSRLRRRSHDYDDPTHPNWCSTIYFNTDDHVLDGESQVAAIAHLTPLLGKTINVMFDSPQNVCDSVEAIVTELPAYEVHHAVAQFIKIKLKRLAKQREEKRATNTMGMFSCCDQPPPLQNDFVLVADPNSARRRSIELNNSKDSTNNGHARTRSYPVVLQKKGAKQLWKLVRYYDNSEMWSMPGLIDEYTFNTGHHKGITTRRSVPLADEWEMFCLSADPCEEVNAIRFCHEDAFQSVFKRLQKVLEEERTAKASRLH
eukprot:Platyproteum_vivax@DN5667_c0_g1_i2.p1